MTPEIEVKFLQIDIEGMQQRLRDIGATCKQPMVLMKRIIMDFPDKRMQTQNSSFVRVRYEGNRTMLTYKRFDSLQLGGAQEIETEVSDFEKTVAIFESIGLQALSVQESKRETWQLGDVEIVLDEWPWLEPYMELEGPNEQALREVAEKLVINWNEGVFGDVMVAYRAQYPMLKPTDTVANLPQVRFGTPVPNFFKFGSH